MSDKNKNVVSNEDEEYERRLYEEQKRRQMMETEEGKRLAAERDRQLEEERRKKLAQDKLELMKLKNGIIEESETIKEEEKTVRVLSTKEKISNFFYHYKLPVIFGGVMLAAFGFMIYDAVTREKPDMYVLSTCNNGLEMRTEELEEFFERYCEDKNGDGEIVVQVISAPVSDDYQTNESNQAKILTQLQMDKTVIILTCDGNYDLEAKVDENGLYTEDNYVFSDTFEDLRDDFEGNDSVDIKGYHFRGEKISEALGWEEMPDNIIMSLRTPGEPLHGDYETMKENYDDAFEILNEIMKDNGDL